MQKPVCLTIHFELWHDKKCKYKYNNARSTNAIKIRLFL